MDMIAIDLDGTLLNSSSQISEENVRAIKEAQEKGVEVVIATGRAEFDVRELFRETGLRTWVIGANGATIHDPEGRLFHATPMLTEDVRDVLPWLEANGFYYEACSDEWIWTQQEGRSLLQVEIDRIKSANPDVHIGELEHAIEKQFGQNGFRFIKDHRDIVASDAPVYNILAFSFDDAKRSLGKERYRGKPTMTLVSSADHNFELEHKDASKGLALQKLASHLGLSMEKTAAVGDSPNDLSMMKMAGHCAAMGNAKDLIIETGDFTTKTNEEHGVAHAIAHWLS
ncbi:UNVERIFIED_CONTAM: Cof-type HAD-IIB family hydrolase [Halobacillus marinus]|nr:MULTISPECIES: Cof-type HAD-IIB family hydrolase [Bacillaceae]QHT48550.1 Cof-type HAD-IIB family hydrolase [Bacillus sp. SB49]